MQNNENIRALYPEEISDWLKQQGEKAFRGKQIFRWLQAQCAIDYAQMTDLSQGLQEKLEKEWPILTLSIKEEQVGRDRTRKYLFELEDGLYIETVLMAHQEISGHIRHTLCVSTQVGCAMGCVFCATGQGGFQRNLRVDEIVGQVLDVTRHLSESQPDFKVSNVVYMGMGEPLLNYDAVLKSIRLLNHPLGQKIGIRRITVSTCGIPNQIKRLAQEGLDIVLALSLHSGEDTQRSSLMPINQKYPLEEVIAACRDYAKVAGRRITFEYVMMQGVNTRVSQAEELCQLLKGIPCNINLIPINRGDHDYKRPSRTTQELFRQKLIDGGFEAVIREEKGADIGGACGQLAGQVK